MAILPGQEKEGVIEVLHQAKLRAGSVWPRINLAYILLRSGIGDLERLPQALQGLGIAEVVINALDFVAARELEAEVLPGAGTSTNSRWKPFGARGLMSISGAPFPLANWRLPADIAGSF